MTEKFSADYYLRGPETGLSNYQDYSWKPEATIPCAHRMMRFLGASFGDTVHDFGCARGYYVKAYRRFGFESTGNDCSQWAVQNCDPDVRGHLSATLPEWNVDWVVAKDVLEHIPEDHLSPVMIDILGIIKKGALIIVPLGNSETKQYVAPQDNADATHVTCWNLSQWLRFLDDTIIRSGRRMVASGGYRLPGVKSACDPYPESVAFLTVKNLA